MYIRIYAVRICAGHGSGRVVKFTGGSGRVEESVGRVGSGREKVTHGHLWF